MLTLEDGRALLGPAAEGMSDARVLELLEDAYRFAHALCAPTEPNQPTLAERRAARGLPPQRRPKRKKVA